MTVPRQLTAWVRCPRPSPEAAVRLFCLPYGGGGAMIYREWPLTLAPAVEVWHVQLPGREARYREPPCTDMAALIFPLIEAMRPHLDRPFALFGHSMGALVAFELTRQLRRDGLPQPVHLFPSARRAPHLPDWRTPLHTLPDSELVTHLNQRYNGVPPAILQSTDLLRMFIPTIRADLTLTEVYEYVPEEPFTCPISAFGGLGDGAVARDDVVGWGDHTSESFTLRMVPGDHFFLQAHRPRLLSAIAADLGLNALAGGAS
ncbi:MAG: thioesterase [Chloroflexi bacterium]|nr:thioesterase [Chloroflexota bacterium]